MVLIEHWNGILGNQQLLTKAEITQHISDEQGDGIAQFADDAQGIALDLIGSHDDRVVIKQQEKHHQEQHPVQIYLGRRKRIGVLHAFLIAENADERHATVGPHGQNQAVTKERLQDDLAVKVGLIARKSVSEPLKREENHKETTTQKGSEMKEVAPLEACPLPHDILRIEIKQRGNGQCQHVGNGPQKAFHMKIVLHNVQCKRQ